LGELVDPSRQDDVRAGVLRTLGRPRGVPAELDQFSSEAFRGRIESILRDMNGVIVEPGSTATGISGVTFGVAGNGVSASTRTR
jgi:hypothetical protein